jgi:prepilin-type N-terminal cleavage/methylation domain-containing protein
MYLTSALRARRRLRRPTSRLHALGFTMLELAVVILIGSVLLLIVTKWVLGLIAVSTDTTQHNATQRDANGLVAQVSADLSQATSCSSSGTGPSMAYVGAYNSATSSQSFGVFTLNDASATPTDPALVIWTFNYDPSNNDTLLNAERTDLGPVSGGCPTVLPPSGFDAATNAATQTIFAGGTSPAGVSSLDLSLVTGVGGTDPGYTGSCTSPSSAMFNCEFTALNFSFIARSSSGLPIVVDSTVLVTNTVP